MNFSRLLPLMAVILMSINFAIAQSSTKIQYKPGVHMTFVDEHIDLGKVRKGEIKKFDYVFTNTGTETIQIDIASGCDCTTIDYPKNKIAPGQKAVLHITFDSGKKEESETVDVDLYLKNKDPKTGHRMLKILDYKYELIK
ncbi:MAG: DUF1573 domain-containing protein [Saprospiraceae bacterium]|nr:MAG: OmpA/MotB domain-containing protein [Bacteroidetes bacterium OLB9]MCO6463097.1 DUF1573 domain-containing protein [Saprospiraceae bacterium]MCZ2339503.1 DUF1573 domain-containing protein [Chitinophagales bacterium]